MLRASVRVFPVIAHATYRAGAVLDRNRFPLTLHLATARDDQRNITDIVDFRNSDLFARRGIDANRGIMPCRGACIGAHIGASNFRF